MNCPKPFFPYFINGENNTCFGGLLCRLHDVTNNRYEAFSKCRPQFLTAEFCFPPSFLHSILSRQLKSYLKTSASLSSTHVLIHADPSVGNMTSKGKVCFKCGGFFVFAEAGLAWVETGQRQSSFSLSWVCETADFHRKDISINKTWLQCLQNLHQKSPSDYTNSLRLAFLTQSKHGTQLQSRGARHWNHTVGACPSPGKSISSSQPLYSPQALCCPTGYLALNEGLGDASRGVCNCFLRAFIYLYCYYFSNVGKGGGKSTFTSSFTYPSFLPPNHHPFFCLSSFPAVLPVRQLGDSSVCSAHCYSVPALCLGCCICWVLEL